MIEHRDDGPYWVTELVASKLVCQHPGIRRDTERVFREEALAELKKEGLQAAGLPEVEEAGFLKRVMSSPSPGEFIVTDLPVQDEQEATLLVLRASIPVHLEDGEGESD